MGTIAQAKTLGQVGSILVLLAIIPAFGSVVAIIGLILTLIAVKYISDALNDASIFSNILIAIVLAIIGVVVGGVLVIGAVFRYVGLRSLAMGTVTTTTPPTHILGLVGRNNCWSSRDLDHVHHRSILPAKESTRSLRQG